MKPRNFPERVNRRRVVALARMDNRPIPDDEDEAEKFIAEMRALDARIRQVGFQRSVRTKKDRSHKAKFR